MDLTKIAEYFIITNTLVQIFWLMYTLRKDNRDSTKELLKEINSNLSDIEDKLEKD